MCPRSCCSTHAVSYCLASPQWSRMVPRTAPAPLISKAKEQTDEAGNALKNPQKNIGEHGQKLREIFPLLITLYRFLTRRNPKNRINTGGADGGGFEPPIPFGIHAFQACAIDHSATHPWRRGDVYPSVGRLTIAVCENLGVVVDFRGRLKTRNLPVGTGRRLAGDRPCLRQDFVFEMEWTSGPSSRGRAALERGYLSRTWPRRRAGGLVGR